MSGLAGPAAGCALAAGAIAAALQISNGTYDGRALALLTAAAAAAICCALCDEKAPERARAPQVVLGAGCAAGLLLHVFANPAFYADPRALAGFRWLAATALVLLSAYLCLHLRASLVRLRFLLLLACFAVMGVALLRASPRPFTEQWILQQGAADALLRGFNPYSVTYPNIYGSPVRQFYAPELLAGGRLAAFPDPPLSVLVEAPFFAVAGDVRYAQLVCLAAAAWLFGRLGGVAGELAALFILFQPRTFFVLEQAWTEPMILAAFALVLLLCARQKPLLAGAMLGLLAASKQSSPYFVAPLAFALPQEGRRGALLLAAAAASAVLVPFALWDFAGFVRGVVRMQLAQPFRADSLSLLSLFARLRGSASTALAALGLAGGAAVLALVLRRATGLAQASAAAGAAWLAASLLGKQSFSNDYWLCSGFLCASVAARWPSLESA